MTPPISHAEQTKLEYDSFAPAYDSSHTKSPLRKLEYQLIRHALGPSLTGLTVLDLGGGSGVHARQALELGAASVDIIDISPGMLQVAANAEKALGRERAMRFFEGDAAKSLAHLPLRGEGPGRFVGIRTSNPESSSARSGKYGVVLKEHRRIPGGVKFVVVVDGDPPVEFEAGCPDVLRSKGLEAKGLKPYKRFGLTEVEFMPFEAAAVVQRDPEFWKDYVEDPFAVVVRAVKM
ncbi:hypothetical protein N0V88_004231 [Collariella sp. IMI 366227]|nr:hypothetical protein N0V88_004231 [Collariella sp. IMI 366227]